MKDLGEFLIADSLRKGDGRSMYFREIHAFLKKYVEDRKLLPDTVERWDYAGAYGGVCYGIVENTVFCDVDPPSGVPVYTWPEFQFMLNLERVLE